MRKVVYRVGLSLDGLIARPDGAFDFLFMPRDYSMGPFFASIDAAVMGRKTFDAASASPKMAAASMPTYIFSRTLKAGERNGFQFTQRSPAEVIHELRQRPGKDIWLMGGGELASDFLREDLVDELYLGIVPCLIGAGLAAFPAGFPQRDFALLENKSYSKGLISLKYKRVRQRRQPPPRD